MEARGGFHDDANGDVVDVFGAMVDGAGHRSSLRRAV
jgi:hypothetical protein